MFSINFLKYSINNNLLNSSIIKTKFSNLSPNNKRKIINFLKFSFIKTKKNSIHEPNVDENKSQMINCRILA